MRNASTSTHDGRTKVCARWSPPSPAGVVISWRSVPSPRSIQARQCTARVFGRNAGVDGVRHLVHVDMKAHRRRAAATARCTARRYFLDVGDPHHRQYRHHHFSDGKRWLAGVSTNSRRLIRDVQADGCGDSPASRPTQSRADGALPRSSIFFSSTGWS